MATAWKKIIVSGSAAELASVYASGPITGSAAKFENLASGATSGTSKIVAIAEADGALKKRSIDVRVFDGGLLGTSGGSAGKVAVYLDSENVYGDDQFTWNATSNVLTISGSTFGRDVSIVGNLTVNGSTTVINTANLTVEDRFILLGSGSTTADAGIIVPTNVVSGVQYGRAFFYDNAQDRWSFNDAVAETNSGAATPQAWAGVVYTGATGEAPTTAPRYGGNTYGHGSIFVDTVTGEIYIYTKDGDAVDSGNEFVSGGGGNEGD